MKKKIFYYLCIVLAVLLLAVGYFTVRGGYDIDVGGSKNDYVRAKITKLTDTDESRPYSSSDYVTTTYHFKAEITSGEMKGKVIEASQVIDAGALYNTHPVSEGDKIIVYRSQVGDTTTWMFSEYVRSDATAVLALLFCASLVLFGRSKGLKTLVTLILTIGSVFFVLIPAIIDGRNIYFWTIVVCLYITAMTLIIVNGISYMSLVGGIGCMGGVLIAAIITVIMDGIIKLTGYTDECTIYIKAIKGGAINLRALVFAGILIGSIGAVMDVAVNIAASLHEVATKVAKPSFRELFKSGITISRDIIGTMSNTLILAYIGSSLCSVLLIIYNNSYSLMSMFNKEIIVVELLKILVGSFGILSALPLTSAVAALFYSKFEKIKKVADESGDDEYSQMLENLDK